MAPPFTLRRIHSPLIPYQPIFLSSTALKINVPLSKKLIAIPSSPDTPISTFFSSLSDHILQIKKEKNREINKS